MPIYINNFHSTSMSAKPKSVGGLGAPAANTSIFIQPTSPTIVDSSPNNCTLTYSCSFVQNSIWNGKYSILSNDNGHHITGTEEQKGVVNLGSGSFTIEVIFTPTGNTQGTYYDGRLVSAERDFNNGWSLDVPPAGGFPYGVSFHHEDRFSSIISVGYAFISGNRYHIAATRNGNVYRVFVNGKQIGTVTSTSKIVSSRFRCLSRGGSYPASIRGKIDAIRVVKGVSLYNSDFIADITKPMYLY